MTEFQPLILIKALFNRQWWWVTLLVILGMALLARLGIWQLDRLAERRAQNVLLAQVLASPPLALTGGLLPEPVAALKDRQVVVAGEFDFEQQVILKVQNWQGRAGVNLITPLLIAGSDKAVLVDRGWIPDAAAAVAQRLQFNEAGSATINGYIALTQTLSRQSTATGLPAAPQTEWFRVDVAAIAAQLPYELLPFYIVQAPDPAGNIALPFRREPAFDLSEGPHLSYAMQWFLFSGMLALFYIVYVNRSLAHTR